MALDDDKLLFSLGGPQVAPDFKLSHEEDIAKKGKNSKDKNQDEWLTGTYSLSLFTLAIHPHYSLSLLAQGTLIDQVLLRFAQVPHYSLSVFAHYRLNIRSVFAHR